ncbi:MAG: DUF99 family protein [Desulfobacteraceae bacterium]
MQNSENKLTRLLVNRKKIRVIGFDDAPFEKKPGTTVYLTGVVCSDTRFEGMLYDRTTKDGNDATKVIIEMLRESKFLPQLNIILLDGIAVGGFNIIDLAELHAAFGLPCVAVMRKTPNLSSIKRALQHFADKKEKIEKIANAGEIHNIGGFIFQVVGAGITDTAKVLARLTDNGKVPEALRLAHLIGSAIMTGESGKRA